MAKQRRSFNSYFGRYVATGQSGQNSGHLFYLSQGVLYAVPFNLSRLETQGSPIVLAEDLPQGIDAIGAVDISRTGTLVYRNSLEQGWEIAWVDNSGKTSPAISKSARYFNPRLSPDGQLLAFAQLAPWRRGIDIFIHDGRREATSALTLNGTGDGGFAWSPDGKHIAYRSGATATGSELLWVRADGAGEPQRLLQSDKPSMIVSSFSLDGRLAYMQRDEQTGMDIWTLPLDLSDLEHPKPGTPEPFAKTAAAEASPMFSPNGRWIAYESDESGQTEVYVRRFPGPGGPRLVSSGGGLRPVWSRNGQQLFYQSPSNRLMVVDCAVSDGAFITGKPRQVSNVELAQPITGTFDVAPDGQRFIALTQSTAKPGATNDAAHVTFMLNVFDELRRRSK